MQHSAFLEWSPVGGVTWRLDDHPSRLDDARAGGGAPPASKNIISSSSNPLLLNFPSLPIVRFHGNRRERRRSELVGSGRALKTSLYGEKNTFVKGKCVYGAKKTLPLIHLPIIDTHSHTLSTPPHVHIEAQPAVHQHGKKESVALFIIRSCEFLQDTPLLNRAHTHGIGSTPPPPPFFRCSLH